MINYIVLLIGLIVASVAGYYSVIGLTTIFAGAFWSVVVMASSIEAAKVAATSWLYRYWYSVPMLIKYYLVAAIMVLSLITSLGVFGFLSKAHTDQSIVTGVTSIQLETVDQQLDIEQKRLDILLEQSGKYKNPSKKIEKQIDDVQNKIIELTEKKAPLLQEQNKQEAEVGPLKYVAELLYGKTDKTTLDSAVRAMIILIVLVFDPLAIVLILAANHGLSTKQPETSWVENIKELKSRRKKGIVIDEQSVYKM